MNAQIKYEKAIIKISQIQCNKLIRMNVALIFFNVRYFPSDIFLSGNFPRVFSQVAGSQVAASQVATSQVCPSHSAMPSYPVITAALDPPPSPS